MAAPNKATQSKLQLIRELVEQGRITVRAEPKRTSYSRAFVASDKPEENYYAVYGAPDAVALLSEKGCLATKRPRTETGSTHKAYLANMDEPMLLALCDPHPVSEPVFAVYDKTNAIHALGLYHTQQPIENAPGEHLTYLALSAESDRVFEPIIKRLTDAELPEFLQTSAFRRKVGKFLIVPVRRSLADGIQRAHPDAIAINGDAATQSAVSLRSMQHVVDQLHEDMRFTVPEPEPVPQSKVKSSPQAVPAANVAPRPLTQWLEDLEPYVVGFERHEQLGGGVSSRITLRMDKALPELLERISSDATCPDREGMFFRSIAGTLGQTTTVPLNETTYERLHAAFPDHTVEHKLQEFQPNWLGYVPVQDDSNPRRKPKMRIDEVRLARCEDGQRVQDWLVVTTTHPKRAEMFAKDIGVAKKDCRFITEVTQQPTIMLLPVTASVAEALATAERKPLARDALLYASYEALTSAQLAQVHDRSATTPTLQQTQKPPEAAAGQGVNVASRQQNAARVIFGSTAASQRLWLHYRRKQPDHHKGKQPETICLGLRIPSAQDTEFKRVLVGTGFIDLPGRALRPIGNTGEKSQKHFLYQLNCTAHDLAAWHESMADDTHWPRVKQPDSPRRLPLLKDDQVKRSIQMLLRNNTAREKPEETAWRGLAKRASSGEIRFVQVHYTADDLSKHMKELQKDLDETLATMARHNNLVPIRQGMQSRVAPLYLYPPLDQQLERMPDELAHTAQAMQRLQSTAQGIRQAMEQFRQWLETQQKNNDDSITVPCLVMREPHTTTLGHLHQAKYFNHASGGEPLFTQDLTYLQGPPILHVQPIHPAFINRLAEYQGHLESMSDEPVLASDLKQHLQETFAPAEIEGAKKQTNKPVMLNPNKNAARRRLLDLHFPRCRHKMLYGKLRPENNSTDLGDRPDGDRIGEQHGLALHIDSKNSWTQHVKPMLEDMESAALHEARKKYVMPLGAADPAPIKQTLKALKAQKAALSDLEYEANNAVGDPGAAFNADKLSPVIHAFIDPAHDLPEALEPLAQQLRALSEQGNYSDAAHLVRQYLRHLERELRDCHNAYDTAADTYAEAAQIARRDGMMKQESMPLFYLPNDDKGYTLAELDKRMVNNFNSSVTREPISFAMYLSSENAVRGELNDGKMFDWLQKNPPELGWARNLTMLKFGTDEAPAAERTEWTRRIRSRVTCPTNVTLAEFFTEADKIFRGPQLGRQ